ncbi:MAG: electron transfer flavoprotein subunit beta/FixA family protein [Syntrophorhabdaceae bacterium]|nr:electron transfer flavoprotein subunit beta/FixA family protein [Syntrophorhabdaceae bacterium]
MNFVCCIKQVPDTAEVKIDPETNTLMRSGVESIANPYDLVALEAALILKDKYGGWVTAVSMGPPQAEQVLKEAISLGADAAVLLSDRAFAGADTLATSYTLYRAIRNLDLDRPVDIVLCGKQAIDGDTAQVGPGIATRLGFTQFTSVVEIRELNTYDRHITVKRRVEGGFEVVRGPLPTVMTVDLGLARPRRASLPGLILSLRAVIDRWDADAVGAEVPKIGLKGSPTWVRRIFSPPLKEGGPVFDGRKDPVPAVERFLDTITADEELISELFKNPGV